MDHISPQSPSTRGGFYLLRGEETPERNMALRVERTCCGRSPNDHEVRSSDVEMMNLLYRLEGFTIWASGEFLSGAAGNVAERS